MSEVLNRLLLDLNIHPVLIDVGSSGEPPAIWNSIAKHSIYIGFDPDIRDPQQLSDDRFHKYIIVDRAITDNEKDESINFYLTTYPHCSSSLKPDDESLSSFLFADLFNVERRVQVKATSLSKVLQNQNLDSIDWLKTDSQGTDFRIFNSLRSNIRSHLLVLDVEPGIIDAYVNEDLFVDTHKKLVDQGFWLSSLNVCGAIRCTSNILHHLRSLDGEVNAELINRNHRKSPAWCEARYLRTLDWMIQSGFSKREYTLMWVFSMMDSQLCFAAEVALSYENKFGHDQTSDLMLKNTISQLKSQSSPANQLSRKKVIDYLKGLLPVRFKSALRMLGNRKFS